MEAVRAGSAAPATRGCWCGEKDLQPYSPDYGVCAACGTLVPRTDTAEPPDDHDLFRRTRTDIPEVGMHWLQVLLRYKLPPAQVLEFGPAHGGLMALLRWAGYEAHARELDPRGADPNSTKCRRDRWT